MVSSFLIQIKKVLYIRCHLCEFMCHVAEAVSCFRSSQSQSLCALVHICGDPSFVVWRLESPLSFRNGCVVQTQFDMTLRRVSHLSFRFIWVDQVIVWKSYDFALDELPSKAHDTRACNVQSLHEFSGKKHVFFCYTSRGSEELL